jgi:ABC-type glycerol-3-phosphate transport system permease component
MTTAPRALRRLAIYVLAILIGVFTLFPFYWIIVLSFKDRDAIFKIPPDLFPRTFTLDNYVRAFTQNNIGRFLLNSFYVVSVSVCIAVLISALAAYAIARFNFKGKALVQRVLISTQAFPTIVILVPLFFLCRTLNIYNSHLSLIIPYVAILVSICSILLISYFASVPRELVEAARIDGCGRFRVFTKIILSLSLPGIASSFIYCFITLWQEFLLASTFLRKTDLYTLTVGLSTFRGLHSTDWGGLMATSVIIALPSLVMFAVAQNYFINNMAGGIKE